MSINLKGLTLGLDIHGVLDNKIITSHLVKKCMDQGCEIHIITGESWETAYETVKMLDVPYNKHFSIVDYHREKGTKMDLSSSSGWWMEEEEWDKTKGGYCLREGIDVMFDDTFRYSKWMPKTTTFILVNDSFQDICKVMSIFAGL